MFDIGLAKLQDEYAVLELCKKFYNTTKYANMVNWDVSSGQVMYRRLLGGDGFVVVARHNDEIVGMLGCVMQPFVPNNNYTIANEIMWWVEPEYRHSKVGGELIRCAEMAASQLGCHLFSMSALITSFDGIDKVLEKLGYSQAENVFVKEV